MNSRESWQTLHTMRLLHGPPLPVVPKRSYNTADYFGVKKFPDWTCCMSETLILTHSFTNVCKKSECLLDFIHLYT